jgi:hypothetical protein
LIAATTGERDPTDRQCAEFDKITATEMLITHFSLLDDR